MSEHKSQDKNLFIECIHSKDGLQSILSQWNDLLQRSPTNNIFLTHEWISTWWEFFGQKKELFILVVRDKYGELIGIAPFLQCYERLKGIRLKTIKFIGSGEEVSPDYLNIIALPNRDEIIREIFLYLWKHNTEWDIIYLTDILEDSELIPTLKKLSGEEKWHFRIFSHNVCPYIHLADSWEEHLQSLNGKIRYEMRRRLKLLQKNHKVRFTQLQKKEYLNEAVSIFFMLHSKRWKIKGSDGIFEFHKNVEGFHRKLALKFFENDWLRLFFFEVDSQTVAALYGFEYNGTLLHYNSGFDRAWSKYGIAKQLIASIIEDSIKKGLKEFDFLKGDEPYKYEWTNRQRRLVRVILWNNTIKSKLHRMLFNINHNLRHNLKFLLKLFTT